VFFVFNTFPCWGGIPDPTCCGNFGSCRANWAATEWLVAQGLNGWQIGVTPVAKRPRFHGVGPSWSGWHVLTLPAPFRRQVGVGNVAVSHFKA